MTKRHLIAAMQEKTGATQAELSRFLDALTESITEQLKFSGEAYITGLAKFTAEMKPEHWKHNPQTMERVLVPKRRNVKAQVFASLVENVRNG